MNWLTELSGPAPSAAGQAWSDVLKPSDVSSSPVEVIAVVAVVEQIGQYGADNL